MANKHIAFWTDFLGKIGPSTFAATLVACLLSDKFELVHGILVVVGILMTGVSHWDSFHRQNN